MMDAARTPESTLEELSALDGEEIREGYHDGLAGDLAHGDNRSKSYWHGWRNGMVDSGRAEKDASMANLAREVVSMQSGRSR